MVIVTYIVNIAREEGNWLASVTNLEGVSTWAPTFSQLDFYVREAIALAEDLPEGAESSLELTWQSAEDSPDINTAIAIAQKRHRLIQEQKELEPQVAEAIAVLADAQWSTRDQATLFGMTPGRVSQIRKNITQPRAHA